MQTVVSVKNPIGSAITPPGHELDHFSTLTSRFLDVADKCLAFVNRYIGIADKRRQLVHDIAGHKPFITPMPGHSDVVDGLAIDLQRAQAPRDQCLRTDMRSRASYSDPVEILNAFFLRQLRTDLHKQLGL